MRADAQSRENLKLDKSPSQKLRLRAVALVLRVRYPKCLIGQARPRRHLVRRRAVPAVQFKISDFGFEMGFCPISQFLLSLAIAVMLSGCIRGQTDGSFPAKNISIIVPF